jgi:bifunctional non-homologous end joining protein LigD
MAKPRPPRTRETKKDGLAEYRAKRDFKKTPEPSDLVSQAGGPAENKTKDPGRLVFCVQKHDATRLHYDVRLEMNGALMSFAVPKGPSYDPQVKRLAVETEDHPMMYADFEARIPDGEYGAGDMLLWDLGTYETIPPGQEQPMRQKGHILVRFFGEKLHGGWHFVRTKGKATDGHGGGGAKPQWLMFKATDETADPARDIVTERPESVKSGKSATRGPRRVGASSTGKSAAALAAAVGDVERATMVGAISDVKAYLYEIKYDGYRILAAKAGDEVKMITRGGHDWTTAFALVARAIRKLPARELVVDGEVCVVDEAGRPSFQALQAWLAGEREEAREGKAAIAYVTFDLLWLDGRDLRPLPIEERRELLEALVKNAEAPVSFSRASKADTREELLTIITAAKQAGLEGLVAKRRGSKYVGGTSGLWRKLKFVRRQDCVIVGWAPMSGAQHDLGALALAVIDKNKLRWAGRVGTGFDARTRRKILEQLAPLATKAQAVLVPPTADGKNIHWVRPELACEVEYGEWTRDGSMRRSAFVAMRDDKRPDECVVEGEKPADEPNDERGSPGHEKDESQKSAPAPLAHPLPGVATKLPKLSNPTKILFPRDGITKSEILAYYLAIAPALLPHLASRPLTLQRWPDGIDGEAWYQQNAPEPLPPFVSVARFEKKKRIIADNVESLAWLANLAALTLHVWSSRVPQLAQPDYTILDLDPGDGTWKDLIGVAQAIHTLLKALSLESAVKTSGKRGIHIVVPLAPGPTHDEATAFALRIAEAVAKVMPDVATTERMKEKRKGRLYIDCFQNGEGRTIVAPYTIRALDGAPVSTPIDWSEVTEKLDPRAFTVRNVPDRVQRRGDLFALARSGKGKIG